MHSLSIYEISQIPEDLQMKSLKEDLPVISLYMFSMVGLNAEKLVTFLMSFAKSVENLSFNRFDTLNNSHLVYEAILSNFQCLTRLSIDFDQLPTNCAFYRNLDVSKKMRALFLSSIRLNNPIGLRGLVKTFPFVSNLGMAINRIENEMQAEDFQYMFKNWIHLRAFFLLTSGTDIINRGFFKKITTLHIDTYSLTVNWADVAKDSPKLTTLIIQTIPSTNRLDLESVLKSLNRLTVLELGYGFTVTEAELAIIQKYPANLRELRLLKYSWKIKQEPKDFLKKINLKIEVKLQETVPSNMSQVGSLFYIKAV